MPLALFKARPRVRKLRFNIEEFAKSDFFKLFDFWKLLESALGGKRPDGSEADPSMPKMTLQREASLPMADPGVSMSQETLPLIFSHSNLNIALLKASEQEIPVPT